MRRTVRLVGAGVGLAVVVLAVEIGLAVGRRYLPTHPALRIDGTFGDAQSPVLRFVVLGDSTGAGVGAGDADEAYPTLLAEALAERGRRVDLTVLAVSGARVADVATEQVPEAIEERPDLVLIAIGGNDVTHLTGLGTVRREMSRAIDALTGAGAQVVVAGPGDMRTHNFLPPLRQIVGWRGRAVESAIASVAQSKGVPVVPLRERTGERFARNPERYFSEDDFHPSAAGYSAWAEAILPELLAAAQRA